MKVCNRKIDFILAQKRMPLTHLRKSGLSPQTLTTVRKGNDVLPATVGRIAEALGVGVAEIIESEASQQ